MTRLANGFDEQQRRACASRFKAAWLAATFLCCGTVACLAQSDVPATPATETTQTPALAPPSPIDATQPPTLATPLPATPATETSQTPVLPPPAAPASPATTEAAPATAVPASPTAPVTTTSAPPTETKGKNGAKPSAAAPSGTAGGTHTTAGAPAVKAPTTAGKPGKPTAETAKPGAETGKPGAETGKPAAETGKPGGKPEVAVVKPAPSEEASACLEAQTKLAFDLIAALAAKSDGGTVVVSPASLAAALAALDRGADKPMKDAIRHSLRFANVSDNALGCLRKWMAESGKAGGPLQHANRVVLSKIKLAKGGPVEKQLQADHVDLTAQDLSKPEEIAKVNGWVKEKTGGAIPAILVQPIREPGIVALNALRFKAAWQTVFDKEQTKPAPFMSLNGTSTVQMMRLPEGEYNFRTNDRFVAVDLPFDGGQFTMTIVTTKDKAAPAPEFAEVATWLTTTDFAYTAGEVSMPQIALDGDYDLMPALNALGLAEGQKSPQPLKGFGPDIRLGSVLQRVRFQADEEGALVAAATAAIGTRGIKETVKMVVDKPFLFSVRDAATGLILVAGYVVAPSTEACADGATGQGCAKRPPG